MVETIATVGLPVDETLMIKKIVSYPKRIAGW